MKTVMPSRELPSLQELLDMAQSDNVLLHTEDGREYLIAELDDFEKEVELVSKHPELRAFLAQRSQEKERVPFDQVMKEFGLK